MLAVCSVLETGVSNLLKIKNKIKKQITPSRQKGVYPEHLNKRYFEPVSCVDPIAGVQRSLLIKKGISRDECGVTAGRRPAIIKRDVLLLRFVAKGICFQT